jgi:hypothetical protein
VVVFRDRVEAAWKSVVVFRDRDIGGVAMNSVEDLDVFGYQGFSSPFQPFQSFNGSTVREASRQASSTAFSSEPVEESP